MLEEKIRKISIFLPAGGTQLQVCPQLLVLFRCHLTYRSQCGEFSEAVVIRLLAIQQHGITSRCDPRVSTTPALVSSSLYDNSGGRCLPFLPTARQSLLLSILGSRLAGKPLSVWVLELLALPGSSACAPRVSIYPERSEHRQARFLREHGCHFHSTSGRWNNEGSDTYDDPDFASRHTGE